MGATSSNQNLMNKQCDKLVPKADWQVELQRLDGAFSPRTIDCYVVDMQRFEAWCAAQGVCALPATPETVCRFLEDEAVMLHPSTVGRRVYGIRKIHRLMGMPDPTDDVRVELSLRRVKRSRLGRPRQAKGMTRDYLVRCLDAQPDTPWGLRNRALISLGYDLLTRCSELIALRTEDVWDRDDGTLRVLIRRSKNDQFGMGRIAFSSQRSGELVRAWIDWRGHDIVPLFCAIYQGQPINRPMSATTLRHIIKRAVAAAGSDKDEVAEFSGHSLRVGAAQDLLCDGFDAAAIMRAGGWKSREVLAGYLELAEQNVWAGEERRHLFPRRTANHFV